MAPRKRDCPRELGTAVQRGRLLVVCPGSRAVWRPNGLVWAGTLTPTGYSGSYEVLIDHEPRAFPLVYVARPHLELADNQSLPHVYSWNTLCLYLDHREWNAGVLIADTLVPWASEWLFFYEMWLATGGAWLGEGPHPTPESANRVSRRSYTKVKEDKLRRLSTGLRLVYGPHADLDDLLYNARLQPHGKSRAG